MRAFTLSHGYTHFLQSYEIISNVMSASGPRVQCSVLGRVISKTQKKKWYFSTLSIISY